MKRSLAIAALLGGCFGDDFLPTDPPPRDAQPSHELPEGVWEPMPGVPIINAGLATDNGPTLWWVVWHEGDGVWLGATSPTGSHWVEPVHISPPGVAWYPPDVAVTPTAVVAKFGGTTTFLRRFDRVFGKPLGDAYPVAIQNGATTIPTLAETKLVATADGGVQLVAALGTSDVAEAAIVNLDASGTPTRTVFVGTPDTYEMIHSRANGVAAAARSDGSTLIAWDRSYSDCGPVRPSSTLTSSVTGSTVGAIQSVHDVPDVSEMEPSIASSGDTAYITWSLIDDVGRYRIALAKFPDVTTALAEIGDPTISKYDAMLTLAEPGRGAIAYRPGNLARSLEVVAFAEDAGTVKVSAPHVIPAVDPNKFPVAVGLVHVDGYRYVLGWIETGSNPRLYATLLDFTGAIMRPAPAFDVHPAPGPRTTRKRRCI